VIDLLTSKVVVGRVNAAARSSMRSSMEAARKADREWHDVSRLGKIDEP
jgi:hypothetical protein